MSDSLALRTKLFCCPVMLLTSLVGSWYHPAYPKGCRGVNRPERKVRAPGQFVLARWCTLPICKVTRFSNDHCLSSH